MTPEPSNKSRALKFKFGPGEYLVTWNIPSSDYETFEAHGTLSVMPDSAPEGSAHGEFPDILHKAKNGGIATPHQTEFNYLTGKLSNGPSVILIDAIVTYRSFENANIDAAAAIITMADTSALSNPEFQDATFQIGGLDAVSGAFPMSEKGMPVRGFFGTWSLEIVDTKQTWTKEGVNAEFNYLSSIHAFDAYSFTASFSPVIRIHFDNPLPFREMIEAWVIPMQRIISIITGRTEPLTYLSMGITLESGHGRTGEVYCSPISQNPYDSTDKEVRRATPVVKLLQDNLSLLELASAWKNLSSQRHPIMETYGTMLHVENQHPRSKFLLLLQALEGAYGAETKAQNKLNVSKFKNTRKTIVEKVASTLNSRQKSFVNAHLRKEPPTNLNNVISWLSSSLNFDPAALLGATELIQEVRSTSEKDITVSDAIRTVRNDLSHGNRGYDPYQLHETVILLDRIMRALTLQLLGCPNEITSRILTP